MSKIEVTLMKCGKQRCSHVLTTDEFVQVPSETCSMSSRSTCPKCGNDAFWFLDANGRVVSRREVVDANEIEPSSRMGLKMKRRILAAKRRAIAQKGGSDE